VPRAPRWKAPLRPISILTAKHTAAARARLRQRVGFIASVAPARPRSGELAARVIGESIQHTALARRVALHAVFLDGAYDGDDGDGDGGDGDGDERHARPDDDARRDDGETRESLSPVGGASQADLRGRCARVFELWRSDEARRNTDGADERHTLPRGGRRTHRRAGSLTEAGVECAAVLEEHDPPAEGSRRRGVDLPRGPTETTTATPTWALLPGRRRVFLR
jgi:hypothetical protein